MISGRKPARPATPPPPWHRAQNRDKPLIERILNGDVTGSIFPLLNLRDHGLDGLAPRAMRMWLTPDRRGVVGLTNDGTLLLQAPQARALDWAGLLATLDGLNLKAVIGPAPQIRPALTGLDLSRAKIASNTVMPAFQLDLAQMKMPEIPPGLELRPIHVVDRAMLTKWRAAYLMEVVNHPPAKARAEAEADLNGQLPLRHFRLLMAGPNPVAMTGLNGVLGDIAQVGGVFVPQNLRGRGLARAAVALHLEEAREAGLRMACLFAASETAARSYRAIGFAPHGAMGMCFFARSQTLEAPPPPEDDAPAPARPRR